MNRFLSAGYLLALTVSAAVLPPRTASAHGGGGDIAVFNTAGRADVGFAILDENDIEQVAFDPTDSVFQAVLAPLVGAPPFIPYDFGSSEPGYDANEGDLPALAELRWNIVGLRFWNGTGTPAFAPVSGVGAGYAPQPEMTDSLGGFHYHATFGLEDLTNDGQPLPQGVYLAEVTMSVQGLAESDSYYLVTLLDDVVSSAADPATTAEMIGEEVRNYLTGVSSGEPIVGGKDFTFYAEAIRFAEGAAVPEPTGVALAVSLLAAAIRRR